MDYICENGFLVVSTPGCRSKQAVVLRAPSKKAHAWKEEIFFLLTRQKYLFIHAVQRKPFLLSAAKLYVSELQDKDEQPHKLKALSTYIHNMHPLILGEELWPTPALLPATVSKSLSFRGRRVWLRHKQQKKHSLREYKNLRKCSSERDLIYNSLRGE